MDKLEQFLKEAMLNKAKGLVMEKGIGCPDEVYIASYLSGRMRGEEPARIERHIADCPWCLEQISLSYEAQHAYEEDEIAGAPQSAVNRAKDIAEGAPGQKGRREKSLRRNLWFLASAAAFILSFAFPRHFLQFLAAALILGIKWVSESEQIHTLIVTLDNRRRDRKDSDLFSDNRLRDKIEK